MCAPAKRMSELAAILSGAVLLGRRGSYRTDGELRRGGMGTIVLAYATHADSEQPLVVKLSLGDDEIAQGRMQQEVAALAALRHPRIVQVVDEGRIDGHAWYAMDYVGPCNLGDILLVRSAQAPVDLPSLIVGIIEAQLPVVERRARVGLPIASAVAVMMQVAETVAYAHAQGVVHRDLKPANILLNDRGEPILCDFGVARGQGLNLNLTAMDEVVGTFDYLAPELLQGFDADEATDCFAIGAMLYECVTGQLPPRRQHAWQPLPLLRAVPQPLAAIIRHALHPDPRRRQRVAKALADDLRRFQRGLGIRAPQPGWWQGMLGAVFLRPMLSGFVLSLLLLCLTAAWLLQQHRGHQEFAWRQPIVALSGSTLSVQEFPQRHAQWHDAGPAQAGVMASVQQQPLNAPEHVMMSMPVPARMGHRVSIAVDTGSADQEVGMFLATQPDVTDSGYIFQLGAYDNSAMLLRRGPQILWISDYTVQEHQRLYLTLERRGDTLSVFKNGEQLVSLRDVLPYAVSYAGIQTYLYADREYSDPPRYLYFSVSTIDVPQLVGIDWLLTSYAMASEGTSADNRAVIAERGIAFADSVAQRLPLDDKRRPMLALRRERLQIVSGIPHQTDITHYSQQLSSIAEYHLHHIQQLEPGSSIQAAHLLRQAREQLEADEFARLILTAERVMYPTDLMALVDDLSALTEDQPVLHDFIMHRVALRTLRSEAYSLRFWHCLQALTDTGRDNFWTRQGAQFQQRLQQWNAFRQRPLMDPAHPLAGGSSMVRQWQQLLQGGVWSPPADAHAEDPGRNAMWGSATIDQLRSEPLPDEHAVPVDIYADGDWNMSLPTLVLRQSGLTSNVVYEQAFRHYTAHLLIAGDPESVLHHMPAFSSQLVTGGALQLAVAGVIRGVWDSSVLFSEDDPVQGSYGELILWLRNPQGPQPDITPDISSSLGPFLLLALARHHYRTGDTQTAQETLRQLQETVPAQPVGQIAEAILRWGWPA